MKRMLRFPHKFRTILVAILLMGGLGALVIRLFYLQVLSHDFFQDKASRQQRLSLTLPPKRGKIIDCRGRDLALSVSRKSFYAVPSEIKDPRVTAKKIAKILALKEKEVLGKILKGKSFIWLKRKVSESESSVLTELKIKGVYSMDEPKRMYPGGKLLSHVIGFTGLDDLGLEGLELSFNNYLKGRPGWRLTERDATGREVLTPRRYEVAPRDGMNLILTIDATIQTLAEAQLDIVMEKYGPQSATMIVIDPATGEIWALANRPGYDLNNATHVIPDMRRNRAITDFFEPGSTFKPFVASAALQEKVVRLTDQFYCEQGSFTIAGHVLHDVHTYGNLSVREIVAKSSNIGMAKVGSRLGSQKIYHYVKKFGFGDRTGVDLPGEISGWVHPVNRWSKLTPYMMSIGQEITVTAMQLARGYCALANGGFLVQPHLVKSIVDTDGKIVYEKKSARGDQVLTQETVDQMIIAMKGVVTEGTGTNAQVEGYAVAGKTGTAQKASSEGGYSHSKYVSSFVGFIPAEHSRAVIAVIVNEPQRVHYGGTVAAPAFKELAGSLMRYLEVPQDQPVTVAVSEKK